MTDNRHFAADEPYRNPNEGDDHLFDSGKEPVSKPVPTNPLFTIVCPHCGYKGHAKLVKPIEIGDSPLQGCLGAYSRYLVVWIVKAITRWSLRGNKPLDVYPTEFTCPRCDGVVHAETRQTGP